MKTTQNTLLITLTILVLQLKMCLLEKTVETLVDDEEYELFQGILGELEDLDILDDIDNAQYNAAEEKMSITTPATQHTVEDTTEDYTDNIGEEEEGQVVDDIVDEFSEEFVEIVKRREVAEARQRTVYLVAGVAGAVLVSLVLTLAILYIVFRRHKLNVKPDTSIP